jgi:hypothetical protein
MQEGVVDGYSELDILLASAAASRPARTPRFLSVCPFCNKKGHKTNRSKKCLFYKMPTPPIAARREDPVARHAEDCNKEQDDENKEQDNETPEAASAFQIDDRMAALQLADDDDYDLFVDADTWSTDDEDDRLETASL